MDIKKWREKLNITQEELALSIGVTKAAVSYWDNGKRMPSIENLLRLAKMFGCSVEELLK